MEVVASLSQGRIVAAQCGLFTHKSVPVIFEPPCIQILSKTRVSISAWPYFHWLPFVPCFVYNNSEVKFMQSSNQMENNKNNCIFLCTKHDCTSG